MKVQLGILFRAGATVTERVKPADGKEFSLKELQRAVGGYIELIPGARPVAYCNEEGSLAGLPPNPLASATFGQPLVGDIIQVTTEKAVDVVNVVGDVTDMRTVDPEEAERWSRTFCLYPFSGVYCIHNAECRECVSNAEPGHHEFTDRFPTALPTLKAAYLLKHARGEV